MTDQKRDAEGAIRQVASVRFAVGMARVPQPAKVHPERTTIEIGAGGTAIALGALLITIFLSARHHWQSAGDLALLAIGFVFAAFGAYVFAQFYVSWLPSLPEPRERKPRVKPSAAQDIAKELLKEDGLWPRWWDIRRRFLGGLTLQQYEALKAREIAGEQKKQAVEAAKPKPPPMTTEALVKKVAEIGEMAKKGGHLQTLEQLVSRGMQLRSAATSRPATDAYTRQFQPGAALALALAAAVPAPPLDVNQWLESVGRFVGQNFAHHYDALHQAGLQRRDAQEIVAAIDRNIAVLHLIEQELAR
jgi:hypothetical protein